MSWEENIDNLRAAFMEMQEQLQPMYDEADKVKGEMIRRGWAAESAETVAAAWVAMLFRGAGQ